MKAYHAVFDVLRKDFLVGEMVWNFADFMTKQGGTRRTNNCPENSASSGRIVKLRSGIYRN